MSSTTRDIDQRSERKELPEGWRWVKLGDVCLPDRQIVEPNTSHAESLAYYSLEHIESETGRILKTPTEPVELEGKSMTFLFDQRHVLYGKLRPYLNKVALPFSSGRCTTEMIPLLPSDDMDRIFLAWLLRRQETVEFAMQGKTGSRMPRADMDSLLMLHIPLPPLPDQQRIAAILKKQMAAVEKARTAAQERLRAIKALPAAFLHQIFPDPGQPLPVGWRWAKLGEVCEVIGGSTPDTGNSAYWNGDIAWVTPTDLGKFTDITILATSRQITLSGLQNCGTQMLPVGSVIMSSRAPIGHLAIAGVSLCTNQGCKSFVPGMGVDSVFLYWAIKRAVPDIQALGSGATFAEVSKSILYQFEIPLPPLPEQQRIVALISEQMAVVEKARIAAEAELKAINTLPAALLRRAFNGEI